MNQRARGLPESYRLNASQIPLLRGIGFALLGILVLLYDALTSPAFSTVGYFAFIGIIAGYCLISWQILRYGYNRVRSVNLGLAFLLLDIPFILATIHRTGANHSVLFFLLIL